MSTLLDGPDALAQSSLVHSFLERAANSPEEVFASFEARPDMTLGATADAIRRFAGALQARRAAPGDRVLIALDNTPDFVVAWLGSWYAGAVTIPVVPDAGLGVYRRAVEVGEPSLIVAGAVGSAKLADMVRDPGSILVIEDESDQALAPGLAAFVDSSAPATGNLAGGTRTASVMFTSGTTGPPKGVCLSHLWFVWASRDVATGMSYGPDDVLYTCLPLGHANAQDTTFGPALISGARVAFDRRFSASRFWKRITLTKATAFNLIGSMPRALLNRDPDEYVKEHRANRAFAIPALPHYREEFVRRFGVQLRQGYGSTEIGVPVFVDPEAAPGDDCGRPVPGTHLRIMRADGLPAPTAETGEICVWSSRPGALTSGYLNDRQRTAEAWREGWFHTGDLGWLDEAGHLHFAGRMGDLLRRKGENISVHDIESVILELEAVEDCAVVAVRAEDGDDQIAAYVVAREGATVSSTEVVVHCTAALGRAAAPDGVYTVASLPKTVNGKVAKTQLIENMQTQSADLTGAAPA